MSETTPAISARGLTKDYARAAAGFRLRTLKSALLRGTMTQDLRTEDTVQALKQVSFEVARGEAFGVIGGNGSGKSTLLKLVAGLLKPSSGELSVNGRVAALIELGAGFHPEISGRENVFINGSVLGLSRRQIIERYERIVEFAGLEDFIEEPVKNYSSGMYVRLGFSVAIHTDPDVLLVDEVLSVGDEAFGRRCLGKLEEHLGSGGTLLVVSHSLDLVTELCDRCLWLESGEAQALGEPRRVIDAYRQAVAEDEGRALENDDARVSENDEERWGSGQAKITAVRLLVEDAAGTTSASHHLETGSAATFEIDVEAQEPLEDFVFGVSISTPRGVECWGTNTDLARMLPQRLSGKATVRLFCPSLRLAPGSYVVDVAVHARDGSPYDYRRRHLSFAVSAREGGIGVYFPEHSWSATGDVAWQPDTE